VGALHSESCVNKMANNTIIEKDKFNNQSFELWNIKMKDLFVDRK
jgi:hypothetical protein